MELKIIQKEYFKLVVLINKSNKLKNEKTKLTFKVIQTHQIEHLYAATHAGSKICLASCGIKNFWQVTGFSGLFELENFLIKILNENSIHQKGDYTELILGKLFPKE